MSVSDADFHYAASSVDFDGSDAHLSDCQGQLLVAVVWCGNPSPSVHSDDKSCIVEYLETVWWCDYADNDVADCYSDGEAYFYDVDDVIGYSQACSLSFSHV